jgi:hypothetical protein
MSEDRLHWHLELLLESSVSMAQKPQQQEQREPGVARASVVLFASIRPCPSLSMRTSTRAVSPTRQQSDSSRSSDPDDEIIFQISLSGLFYTFPRLLWTRNLCWRFCKKRPIILDSSTEEAGEVRALRRSGRSELASASGCREQEWWSSPDAGECRGKRGKASG